MKKTYLGLVLGMAVTAAVLAGCSQKEPAKTTGETQTAAAESQTAVSEASKPDEKNDSAVYGKVDVLEGEDGVVIKLGALVEKPDADTGALKENGETKTIHIGKDVKVTAEENGKETEADFYSISEGAILKIGYDGENPVSVEILNDDLVLFANQIKEAFSKKDVEALDSMVSYPFYFTGTDGKGTDVADKAALTKVKDEIFSQALIDGVAAFDTSTISPLNIGFVIGSESGGPSVEFDRFTGGKLKISMINAAK